MFTGDTESVGGAKHAHSHGHHHQHGAAQDDLVVTEVGGLETVAQAFLGQNLDQAGFHADLGCCGCC